jgi:uncharacterized protein (TIGR02246 family)
MGVGLVSLILLTALPALAAEDVRAAIEAANKGFEAAFARSDAPGVAALYTAQAQLLPAHSDVVTGAEAISRFWQAAFDSGATGVSLVTLEVEGYGDTAIEVGRLELRGADSQVLDQGKYIVIWKKEGGVWKLHRDIWTTSVAADAP